MCPPLTRSSRAAGAKTATTLTPRARALLIKLHVQSLFVRGPDVMAARQLDVAGLAALGDNGSPDGRNGDGERWIAAITPAGDAAVESGVVK